MTGTTDVGIADMPLWRSLLYVPATAERFVAKAADRGADGVILDLEDSIPPDGKAAARAALATAVPTVAAGGGEVLVRINRPWRLALPDLEASVIAGVTGLCLPKVDSRHHLVEIDQVVSELEAERDLPVGRIRFCVLVETAQGIAEAREIAKGPRVAGIVAGGEDLAADLGLPEPDPEVLAPYEAAVRLAAREAGVMPIGYPGSIAEFTDLDLFRRCAEAGRRAGSEGGMAIHPAQVPVLNAAFAPSAEEIAHAEGLLAAFESALAQGLGAVAYKGKMIDKPIVDRARRILEMRDRIAARRG
ncbi:CoA ester lyase [Thalassobaculum fulvum]|jgi:citrate lyase subunit beta/citryl-CoA lyase|uniref:CoA ester lyase n=1 Tax=Thalassobaculum fulvum TaxID=1633335 RepID=A0A918XT75_9PROT|nr:CoA ester lyase [Thalassobaculum fulvum]GHD54330.1 CoA ester lyase [Thalassobaculum fulvum]